MVESSTLQVKVEELVPLEELYNLTLTVTTREEFLNRDNLLRVLRAREHKVPAAFEMWKKWYEWRITYRADSITEEEMLPHILTWKSFYHGEDLQGRPLLIIRSRHHWPKQFPPEEAMRYIIYLVEIGCKLADEKGVGQISVLVDRSGTTPDNKDPNLSQIMRTLMGMLQDFYAERLGAVFVVHVNWFFWLVYQTARPLLSRKTKDKVHVLRNENGLKDYFHPSQLLVEYGGTDEYVHPYENTYRN